VPLLVNQLPALSVRLVTPWTGVWFAEVEVGLDDTGIVPSGPCALTIGTSVYLGTVDPRASGAFAKTAKLRILGGGGGWHKNVVPIHLHNPATVLSTAVFTATATEVGEVVVDTIPKPLGPDYARCGWVPGGDPAPASRVFGDADWYVTPQGITTVGPRLPVPYNPLTVDILSWDPLTRTAELASDEPIAPGTILLDPLRFDGPITVRDVEQTWAAGGGARATAFCADKSGSRLQTALTALVIERAGIPYLKSYLYRVAVQDPTDETLFLQIVDPTTGAPNALPFSMWMGVPGIGAKVLLGTEVIVTFINGDPTKPAVVGFKSGQYPILLELGEGLGGPLALATGTQAQMTAIVTAIGALAAYVAALTALAATPPTSTTFTLFGIAMAAPGATVAAALAGLTASVAGLVPTATSTRVVSD
jgi:hypothetical protein